MSVRDEVTALRRIREQLGWGDIIHGELSVVDGKHYVDIGDGPKRVNKYNLRKVGAAYGGSIQYIMFFGRIVVLDDDIRRGAA